MNPKAVPQQEVHTGLGQVPLLLLALVGLLSVALTSTALAAPAVGKNGQVNACYRVKGKSKGAMRVVVAGKKCRKGERKLAWSVTGPPGAQGVTGAQGGQGGQGSTGSNGSNGAAGTPGTPGMASATLETKIASLTLQVESLEGILDGVETGLSGVTSNVTGLTSNVEGVEDVLKGVTNTGLTEAIKAAPAVGALCTQATALTSQSNLLGTTLGGLSLNGALTVLGGLLNIPALPAALPAFTCPS
jgi:hypothetical protein